MIDVVVCPVFHLTEPLQFRAVKVTDSDGQILVFEAKMLGAAGFCVTVTVTLPKLLSQPKSLHFAV